MLVQQCHITWWYNQPTPDLIQDTLDECGDGHMLWLQISLVFLCVYWKCQWMGPSIYLFLLFWLVFTSLGLFCLILMLLFLFGHNILYYNYVLLYHIYHYPLEAPWLSDERQKGLGTEWREVVVELERVEGEIP